MQACITRRPCASAATSQPWCLCCLSPSVAPQNANLHKYHKRNCQNEENFSQVLVTSGFISVQSAFGSPGLCSCCSWFRCRAGFPCQWGEGSEAIKACCCLWVVDSNGWLQTTCSVALEASAWPLNCIDVKGPGKRPHAVARARPLASDQHGAEVKGNAYWMMAVWSCWCTVFFLNNVIFMISKFALILTLDVALNLHPSPLNVEHWSWSASCPSFAFLHISQLYT